MLIQVTSIFFTEKLADNEVESQNNSKMYF